MKGIIHPKKFGIDGFIYEIVSEVRLTDAQAFGIVRHTHALRKLKKKDKGKVSQLIWSGDKEDARLFG
jgi:hypothetical protein